MPSSSITAPEKTPIDIDKLPGVTAGKPVPIPGHAYFFKASKSKAVSIGQPRICTPGQGGFDEPQFITVKDSAVAAEEPDVIEAKDMDMHDQNLAGFRYFRKQQGLKSDVVRSIHEDKLGNLWLGTWGGGICRYDGKSFATYSAQEGLNNDEIYNIQEDRIGNLWISTKGSGAIRYDGRNFNYFSKEQGLLSDIVYCMLEDSKGRIWLGTYTGGVAMYDGKSLTNYTTRNGLSSNTIYSIMEDKHGNIWFGTWGGGAMRYDGQSFSHYTKENGLLSNDIMSIHEDSKGNIWFGAKEGGLVMYDGASFFQYTTENGLSSNEVYSIHEDRHGKLWFGTWGGGVSVFDGQSFIRYANTEGLSSDYIYSIHEDRYGHIWLGTSGGGISIFSEQSFSNLTSFDGLSKNEVYSILEDHSGNIWFGTWDGGITKFDGQSYSHYTITEGLNNSIIYCMHEDKSGNIWIGTSGGGINHFDGKSFKHLTSKEGLINDYVLSVFEDNERNLWFGTFGGGVVKYDGQYLTNYSTKNGLSDNQVLCITQDKSGAMWFGTYGGGVTKFDGSTFTHFKASSGLRNDIVYSIIQDQSGNMWFATYGEGLARYDGNNFAHFTTKDGLSNNYIISMKEDSSGEFWIGSRNGINRTNSRTLNEYLDARQTQPNTKSTKESFSQEPLFHPFGFSSGFTGIGCKQGAMLRSGDGTLWVGTDNCVTAIKTENLTLDTIAPNIHLTDLDLFNEKVSWKEISAHREQITQLENGVQVEDIALDSLSKWYYLPIGLSLSHNNNYINFRFVGITLNEPDRVKYKYKLEGLDKDWSAITTRNEAPYGNIPPGEYTFQVMAMNSNGLWSKPYSYAFTIRPPWWSTWWAFASYILFIAVSIISYIRWRERSLLLKQKDLEIKVDHATLEIRKQKEEVEKQKDEADLQRKVAEEQKHVAEEQKHLVQEKNREILDSIEYAKRIQTAILPPPRMVKQFLKNSFILYLPKDIVAGDFYWMESIDDVIYFAACDCTGHGVPGAMVSVVCNNALSRSMNEFALRKPGDIFDKTRELVIENFAKSDEDVKDGMDASLCALDIVNRKLMWAGANNPIWILRAATNTIEEIKADKQSIGKAHDPKPFITHEISLEAGDTIYLFTDGYADQFGGENNKKLTRAKFRDLLLTLSSFSMEDQRKRLLQYHDEYRGTQDQIDDICVIGVRV